MEEKIEYIIALLEKICYICNIDTEPIKSGIVKRYDLYYKDIFMCSFDSPFKAKAYAKQFFGEDNPNLHIKIITISQ